MLEGGDTRSIGKVPDVIRLVGDDPVKFSELLEGIYSPDEVVRLRSADAIEKISRRRPGLLQAKKKELIKYIGTYEHPEVFWQLSVALSYLELTKKELPGIISKLIEWLNGDKMNQFAKVNCMQALANIAEKNPWFKKEVAGIIEEQMEKGKAAIKARGRILLKKLSR